MTSRIDAQIRTIPDFPKAGIQFKDITPLLANAEVFSEALALMEKNAKTLEVDAIVGIESRGFLFGVPLALALGIPFVPARKPGKLPAATVEVEYALEYGTDKLQMHEDALKSGQRVLIVDDLLATGGTAAATALLIQKVGAIPVGLSILIELSFLDGKSKLGDVPVHAILSY